MDEENKKINLESFFKRVDSVDKIASSALSKANSNLGIVNNQKSLIESLSISIEAMQEKIRDIANYIIIEKKLERDLEEDRRLEAEDAEQKRLMTERAAARGQTVPQAEPGKPAESQGGGGGFLGGLVKTLGALMAGGFALKYIGPVLLPKLLLLAKTKLFPIIGAGLKTAVTSSFKFLGGLVTKLFSPLTTAPIIGKIFKGIAFASPFLAVGGFLGSKILDFFSKGGKSESGTGVSSDSNLSVTDPTVETDMTDTMQENDLVPAESFSEYRNRTGNVESEEEEVEEVEDTSGKKFKVTRERRSMTKEEKRKFFEDMIKSGEEGLLRTKNARKIQFHKKKIQRGKEGLRDMGDERYKSYRRNVTEEERLEAVEELVESGVVTPGKYTESTFIERTKVEPLDLSLKQSLETNDKLVNAVSYQSGTTNKDQNGSVVVQNKPAQVTIASIKKTSSSVPFIKASKNQYLSINDVTVPPEVAKMLT